MGAAKLLPCLCEGNVWQSNFVIHFSPDNKFGSLYIPGETDLTLAINFYLPRSAFSRNMGESGGDFLLICNNDLFTQHLLFLKNLAEDSELHWSYIRLYIRSINKG